MAKRNRPKYAMGPRGDFVRPELTPCPDAVREALATVAAAVTSRSAEIYAGCKDTPFGLLSDAVSSTFAACHEVKWLARFLDVEPPPVEDAMGAWRRSLPS